MPSSIPHLPYAPLLGSTQSTRWTLSQDCSHQYPTGWNIVVGMVRNTFPAPVFQAPHYDFNRFDINICLYQNMFWELQYTNLKSPGWLTKSHENLHDRSPGAMAQSWSLWQADHFLISGTWDPQAHKVEVLLLALAVRVVGMTAMQFGRGEDAWRLDSGKDSAFLPSKRGGWMLMKEVVASEHLLAV